MSGSTKSTLGARNSALLLAWVCATALAACAGPPRLKLGQTAEGEVVEAEGVVPLQRGDLPATEAAALAAAQRAAVEKVVGVYVSGKTLVEKAVVVENRIFAKTSGYISKYDLISKGPEGDFYRVRIRALVQFKQIGEDLKAAGLLDVAAVGTPRVAVLLEESIDGSPSDGIEGAHGLTQALLGRGYVVVERAAFAGAVAQAILDAVARGELKKVADLGAEIGAEVVVTGTVGGTHLKDQDEKLGGLVSYRARAAVQAVRSGTGQILATASRDAGALDATKGLAATKALAAAAGLAGEDLAGSLYAALQAGAEVSVVLRGVRRLESLQKFQEGLRTAAGPGRVLLRRYAEGAAEIAVVGSAQGAGELAAHIARMRAVPVEVDTYSQSRVEATLKE